MSPNIIWSKNHPKDYEKYAAKENKILFTLERIGEATVSALCLIFIDFNTRITAWSAVLALAFALMILYEIYWIRYFKSEKTIADMYSSILGVPIAGAALPVTAFFSTFTDASALDSLAQELFKAVNKTERFICSEKSDENTPQHNELAVKLLKEKNNYYSTYPEAVKIL